MRSVRPLRFAGRLYPRDPEELRNALEAEILRSSGRPLLPAPELLLLPHGGMEACGALVAMALARLGPGPYQVALIGPSHDPSGEDFLILGDPRSSWRTLHGEVSLCKVLSESWQAEGEVHDREHSLESLACSFASRELLDGLLPILLTPGFERVEYLELANDLESWLHARDRRLLVATTDLDHYHGTASGPRMHALFMDLLSRGDPDQLWQELASGSLAPCGAGASWLFLELARRLSRRVEVLGYGWAGESVGAAVGFTAAVAS